MWVRVLPWALLALISLKFDVKLAGLKPEILLAVQIACNVYEIHGFDCVITSALDGTHLPNSKHYSGEAIDLRIWHIPRSTLLVILSTIRSNLTHEYDVVLESTHIHIEFDPP